MYVYISILALLIIEIQTCIIVNVLLIKTYQQPQENVYGISTCASILDTTYPK